MRSGDLLLIGAGGHAKSCADVIERGGAYRIAGVVGLPLEVGQLCLGYSIIAADPELARLAKLHPNALICVGQIESPNPRMRLFDLARAAGFAMPAIISPLACVSRHAVIGEGTIVMHGAVVNAGAVVGRNCIVNTQALIEHDAVVGDHCHISTKAALNGGAGVGAGSFVGSGAIIREGLSLPERSFIKMGARVTRLPTNDHDATKPSHHD